MYYVKWCPIFDDSASNSLTSWHKILLRRSFKGKKLLNYTRTTKKFHNLHYTSLQPTCYVCTQFINQSATNDVLKFLHMEHRPNTQAYSGLLYCWAIWQISTRNKTEMTFSHQGCSWNWQYFSAFQIFITFCNLWWDFVRFRNIQRNLNKFC